MSGHSKWSTIKRAKGANDARRSQLFTKLAREISVAAREGGGSLDANFRLRLAVQRARDQNMPHDNIDRAVRRGAGASDGSQSLQELTLEGYGPGGVAILVTALSDNKNRTLSDVRNVFARQGGNLGESGCVAWNFDSRGVITLRVDPQQSEDLALQAIDAGVEDFDLDESLLEIRTAPETFEGIRQVLEEAGATPETAEVSLVAKSTVLLEPRQAQQTLRLLDKLEDLDDVQRVYTNADFPDEALEQYRAES